MYVVDPGFLDLDVMRVWRRRREREEVRRW